MRQTTFIAAIFFLLLPCTYGLAAQPIVRGYYVDSVPEQALSSPLEDGKRLVLAQVFNPGTEIMESGDYKIGVELLTGDTRRSFSISPHEDIQPSTLKTFRLALPIDESDIRDGSFRVFAEKNDDKVFSVRHDFIQSTLGASDPLGIRTLYTEAPDDPDMVVPPDEMPFADSQTAQTVARLNQETLKKFPDAAVSKPARPQRTSFNTSVTATNVAVKPESAMSQAVQSETRQPTTRVEKPVETKEQKTAQNKQQAEKKENNRAVSSTVKPAEPSPQKTEQKHATQPSAQTRNFDRSQFKTLRTIDEELVIYVVKDGDTLESISEKYYGSSSRMQTIADLNFIQNTASIRVGEEIIVEVKPIEYARSSGLSSGNFDQVFAGAGGKQTYTVRRGDTLSSIAQRLLGSSSQVNRIISANPGINPNRLRIGEVIVIPESGDRSS